MMDSGVIVRLPSEPYFSLLYCFAPTLLKMPYYPHFFILKFHLRIKITKRKFYQVDKKKSYM